MLLVSSRRQHSSISTCRLQKAQRTLPRNRQSRTSREVGENPHNMDAIMLTDVQINIRKTELNRLHLTSSILLPEYYSWCGRSLSQDKLLLLDSKVQVTGITSSFGPVARYGQQDVRAMYGLEEGGWILFKSASPTLPSLETRRLECRQPLGWQGPHYRRLRWEDRQENLWVAGKVSVDAFWYGGPMQGLIHISTPLWLVWAITIDNGLRYDGHYTKIPSAGVN